MCFGKFTPTLNNLWSVLEVENLCREKRMNKWGKTEWVRCGGSFQWDSNFKDTHTWQGHLFWDIELEKQDNRRVAKGAAKGSTFGLEASRKDIFWSLLIRKTFGLLAKRKSTETKISTVAIAFKRTLHLEHYP